MKIGGMGCVCVYNTDSNAYLLAPDLPSNWSSIRDLNCSNSNCQTSKEARHCYWLSLPLCRERRVGKVWDMKRVGLVRWLIDCECVCVRDVVGWADRCIPARLPTCSLSRASRCIYWSSYLCQNWVIYAPAAFLGCGRHLSGALSGIKP